MFPGISGNRMKLCLSIRKPYFTFWEQCVILILNRLQMILPASSAAYCVLLFLLTPSFFCKTALSGRFLHVENKKTSGRYAACFSFLQTGIMLIPDNGFVVLPVGIPLCTEKQYPGGVLQIHGIFQMGKVWVGRDFSRRSGR